MCISLSIFTGSRVTSGATFKAPYFSPCFFEAQMYLINYDLAPVAASTGRLKGTAPSLGTDSTLDSHWTFLLCPQRLLSAAGSTPHPPLLRIDLWSALTSFSHLFTSGSANPLGSTFKIYSESNHFSPPPLCPLIKALRVSLPDNCNNHLLL